MEGTVPIADSAAKELGLKPGQIIQAVVEARGQTLSMLINGKNFDLPPHLSVHHGTILYYRAIFNNKGIFLKNINLASNSENNVQKNNLDPIKVKILTSLIFINIAPLHHHPYSQFLFYLGKYYLYKLIDENEKSNLFQSIN